MTIRVLLLDDSAICRAQLRDILERDGSIEVVGEAYNGDQVLRLIDEVSPHILLVDLQMPGTGGNATIERVMAHAPLPILIVTGQPEGVRRQAVFEAVRRGALDLAEKPAHGDTKAETRLRSSVRELSRVRVVRHVAGRLSRRDGTPGLPTPMPPRPLDAASSPLLVGVAASAGGPRPLVSLLASWPRDFPAAIAVVQHLPNGFTGAFAEFLQSRVELRVSIVKQLTRLEPGHVYLANDDEHLIAIGDRQLGPDRGPLVEGHRPAATVLFESMAARLGARACGVILSGMGRDGVAGLVKMKARGALTLAQDEASLRRIRHAQGRRRRGRGVGVARTASHRPRGRELRRAFAERCSTGRVMSARRLLDELLESCTGIEVTRGGIDVSVDTFVTRRCAELKLSSLERYLPLLSPGSAELEMLLNAITVTHTWFMRDAGQLAVVSELLSRQATSATGRIWVPGCATGEDVYSIMMLAERAGRSVEVLGTDINSAALTRAEHGVYGSWSVRDLDEVERHFERGERSSFRLLPRLKRGVRFERHNLLDPPPPGPWDIVLCRNVLIYLSRERARTVVQQLGSVLGPGGCLLLGASEVVFEVPPELEATYIAGRLALRRSEPTRATRPSTRQAALPPRGAEHTWRAPLPALPQEVVSISARAPSEAPPPPASAEALLARGHALLDRSELPAAIMEYELAVDAAPTHAEAHMYLGIALYLNGSLEAALHELRAAVFLDSKLWPAAFYLAVCHEARGETAEALREYRHVVRVASTDSASRATGRHSAWHRDLLELSRRRAGSAA